MYIYKWQVPHPGSSHAKIDHYKLDVLIDVDDKKLAVVTELRRGSLFMSVVLD